jgi:hypothetical protein
MDGSIGTEVTPTHRKLITLSSLSNKKGDSVNKRTRSSTAHSNDQEHPSNKRPPSTMSLAVQTAQNMLQQACDLPSAEAKSAAVRSARDHIVAAHNTRNQEKEEAIQEEIRRSAQKVRWTKGPLPSNIDHWSLVLRSEANW